MTPQPDYESARLLIARLRTVADRFNADLDAQPNATTLSGSWFDLCDDLTQVHRWAERLRNEAFQTSIHAAAPGLLPAADLDAARALSAAFVAEHQA